jgi:nucleotide-binding universal stress UspA family protein
MYLMARDRELPLVFRRLNDFGVPTWGLVVSAAIPLSLVLLVSDLSDLAELYAVGVVGAIATNLGACSTDRKLELRYWERAIMFVTFLVMLGIEISLFVDKPSARVFAITVLAIGLILRALAREQAQRSAFAVVLVMLIGLFLDDVRAGVLAVTIMAGGLILRGLLGERNLKRQVRAAGLPAAPGVAGAEAARKPEEPLLPVGDRELASGTPLLCAVRGIGKTLDFALEEAREGNRPLYLLFVREQPIITSEDRKRKWRDDTEASDIFGYAHDHADGAVILPGYAVSDSPADTIVDFAATIGASRLLLGAPARSGLVTLLRGNIIRQVSNALPEDIHLLICA